MYYLRSLSLILLGAFLSSYVIAHDNDHDKAHKGNMETIEIHGAKINATVQGMAITGAYFHLKNNSDKAITLVNASSDISDRVEIHEHILQDGLMRMQPVTQDITVPAKGMIMFKPGGYHIMLMNLNKAIKEGENITIKLTFADGTHKLFSATASKPGGHIHH